MTNFMSTILQYNPFLQCVLVLDDITWHKIKPNSFLKPSARFGALTWMDDQNLLWLFGGKNFSKFGDTESRKQLKDLWTFNPKTFKWYNIPNRNMSTIPQFTDGLSCFSGGLAFLFGHNSYMVKASSKLLDNELWAYNISSNSWSVIDLPEEVKNSPKCLALWCNHNPSAVSFFCISNTTTSLQVWTYTVKANQWMSLSINTSTDYFMLLKSGEYSTWADASGTAYIYLWPTGNSSNSSILSVTHNKITFIQVIDQSPEYRSGFIHWIDSNGNLHLFGGEKCNSTHVYSDEWMFDITRYKWVSMKLHKPNPSPRNYASFWKVGNSLWVHGGYMRDTKHDMVVLQDLWFGKTSSHVVPTPEYHLPGDTLGLSMVHKLIISGLILLVVITISLRLCYKRELNQVLSQLKKRRVPYQQLSQEGDRSSRL